MEVDENGRGLRDHLLDVFGGLVSDDFLHVAVVRGTRERAEQFGLEFVHPSVVDADAERVDAQVADELVVGVEYA